MSKLIPGYYRCLIPTMRWKSDYIKAGDVILANKIDIRDPKRAGKLATRFEFVKPREEPKKVAAVKKAPRVKKIKSKGGK